MENSWKDVGMDSSDVIKKICKLQALESKIRKPVAHVDKLKCIVKVGI